MEFTKENIDLIFQEILDEFGVEYRADAYNGIVFTVKDPVYGLREMKMYEHEGDFVCTNWQWEVEGMKPMPNIAYIHNCNKNAANIETFRKKVRAYLTDKYAFWYEPAVERWAEIEELLGSFIKDYGAYFTTAKFLKTPVLTQEEKAKMLSYLQLDDCIQAAKEVDAMHQISLIEVKQEE